MARSAFLLNFKMINLAGLLLFSSACFSQTNIQMSFPSLQAGGTTTELFGHNVNVRTANQDQFFQDEYSEETEDDMSMQIDEVDMSEEAVAISPLDYSFTLEQMHSVDPEDIRPLSEFLENEESTEPEPYSHLEAVKIKHQSQHISDINKETIRDIELMASKELKEKYIRFLNSH